MRLREPDNKKMNVLRLLPVYLLVVAILFTGHSTYLYLSGAEENLMWVGLGALGVLYFSVRSWFALRSVFLWGEEEEAQDQEDDESQ